MVKKKENIFLNGPVETLKKCVASFMARSFTPRSKWASHSAKSLGIDHSLLIYSVFFVLIAV